MHLANPAAIEQYEGMKHTDEHSRRAVASAPAALEDPTRRVHLPEEERPVRDLLRRRPIGGKDEPIC